MYHGLVLGTVPSCIMDWYLVQYLHVSWIGTWYSTFMYHGLVPGTVPSCIMDWYLVQYLHVSWIGTWYSTFMYHGLVPGTVPSCIMDWYLVQYLHVSWIGTWYSTFMYHGLVLGTVPSCIMDWYLVQYLHVSWIGTWYSTFMYHGLVPGTVPSCIIDWYLFVRQAIGKYVFDTKMKSHQCCCHGDFVVAVDITMVTTKFTLLRQLNHTLYDDDDDFINSKCLHGFLIQIAPTKILFFFRSYKQFMAGPFKLIKVRVVFQSIFLSESIALKYSLIHVDEPFKDVFVSC